MSISKFSVVRQWLYNLWLSTTVLPRPLVSTIDRTLAAVFIVSINTEPTWVKSFVVVYFAVDKGQFEAATALGFTHGQTMRKIVLPQVIRNILPATGNELVINIKDTSVWTLSLLWNFTSQVTLSQAKLINTSKHSLLSQQSTLSLPSQWHASCVM